MISYRRTSDNQIASKPWECFFYYYRNSIDSYAKSKATKLIPIGCVGYATAVAVAATAVVEGCRPACRGGKGCVGGVVGGVVVVVVLLLLLIGAGTRVLAVAILRVIT